MAALDMLFCAREVKRMDEQGLKELLIRENADFRQVHEEHRVCEAALAALRGKAALTPAEELEEKELKKRKLALKSRMYVLMEEVRRARR
jgi:uncharacterized protein YdcH (DUF465 family)